jgi:uncharacterized membrane protein YhaH (DUF805 family)
MKWMVLPYRRYFDFGGKSRRKEYWLFLLFMYVALIGMVILSGAFSAPLPTEGAAPANSAGSPLEGVAGALVGLLFLGSIIPFLAVRVRRFHDQNMSGWFIFLGLIPFFGGLHSGVHVHRWHRWAQPLWPRSQGAHRR